MQITHLLIKFWHTFSSFKIETICGHYLYILTILIFKSADIGICYFFINLLEWWIEFSCLGRQFLEIGNANLKRQKWNIDTYILDVFPKKIDVALDLFSVCIVCRFLGGGSQNDSHLFLLIVIIFTNDLRAISDFSSLNLLILR